MDNRFEKLEYEIKELHNEISDIKVNMEKLKNDFYQMINGIKDLISASINSTFDEIKDKQEKKEKEQDKRLEKLETAEANKALKFKNKVMELILVGIVTYILGIVTNEYTQIRNHNINNINQNKEVVENVSK